VPCGLLTFAGNLSNPKPLRSALLEATEPGPLGCKQINRQLQQPMVILSCNSSHLLTVKGLQRACQAVSGQVLPDQALHDPHTSELQRECRDSHLHLPIYLNKIVNVERSITQ